VLSETCDTEAKQNHENRVEKWVMEQPFSETGMSLLLDQMSSSDVQSDSEFNAENTTVSLEKGNQEQQTHAVKREILMKLFYDPQPSTPVDNTEMRLNYENSPPVTIELSDEQPISVENCKYQLSDEKPLTV
jgi:hypothetical protein